MLALPFPPCLLSDLSDLEATLLIALSHPSPPIEAGRASMSSANPDAILGRRSERDVTCSAFVSLQSHHLALWF